MQINLLNEEYVLGDLSFCELFGRHIFRFKINVPRFKIYYQTDSIEKSNSQYMGASACEGLAIMCKKEHDKDYRNIDVWGRKGEADIDVSDILDGDKFYEVLIYGPVVAKLKEIKLVISEEGKITPILENNPPKILIMGGLHSFGVGCTTASMMFGNIIARKISCIPYQLSFDDSNFLKRIHHELERLCTINENYDILIMELDYILQDMTILEIVLPILLKRLKLFHIKKILLWHALPPKYNQRATICKNIVQEHFQEKSNYDVSFIDMSELWSVDRADMFTCSHEYINDAANVYIFKKMSKCLEKSYWNI